jgi:hypothetical protein
MDITMPPSFPSDEFRAFGIVASAFFPKLHSEEDVNDPLARRRHFERSWQAVRYRYRGCAECNDEFKALLNNASEMWQGGWSDEELTYKLERCIYAFFMNGLSVFDSFGFCLYCLGGALRPAYFPHVATPIEITLKTTRKAFKNAFATAAITARLIELLPKPEFTQIKELRNILAHRLSGRRSVCAWSDGTTHTREETWHVPGSTDDMPFSEDMLQHHLTEITDMLTELTSAAREFAESEKPPAILP